MAMTALALHNAIRTYAHQQRTGQGLLLERAGKSKKPPPDSVSLSATAQNISSIRQVAASVVLLRHGSLSPTEQVALIDALEQKARVKFADRLDGEALPVAVLQEWLLSLDQEHGGARQVAR